MRLEIPEYIACSAIWYDDGIERIHNPRNTKTGIVACGLRHCNCFLILSEIYKELDYIKNNKNGDKTIQGFLTSRNRFVDRKEGMEIALAAKQIPETKKELYSEDLY